MVLERKLIIKHFDEPIVIAKVIFINLTHSSNRTHTDVFHQTLECTFTWFGQKNMLQKSHSVHPLHMYPDPQSHLSLYVPSSSLP